MPHDITLISTIAVGFALAFLFGFLATRLGLSPLVGYLVAGVAVGPFTPGFVADRAMRRTVGRDRRHAADVRRGPAFLRGRSAGRAAGGAARRRRRRS